MQFVSTPGSIQSNLLLINSIGLSDERSGQERETVRVRTRERDSETRGDREKLNTL